MLLSLIALVSIGLTSCTNDDPAASGNYAAVVAGTYVGTGRVSEDATSKNTDTFSNMRITLIRVSDTRCELKMETATGKSFFNSTAKAYVTIKPAKNGDYILEAEWSSAPMINYTPSTGKLYYIAPIKKNGQSGYTIQFVGTKNGSSSSGSGSNSGSGSGSGSGTGTGTGSGSGGSSTPQPKMDLKNIWYNDHTIIDMRNWGSCTAYHRRNNTSTKYFHKLSCSWDYDFYSGSTTEGTITIEYYDDHLFGALVERGKEYTVSFRLLRQGGEVLMMVTRNGTTDIYTAGTASDIPTIDKEDYLKSHRWYAEYTQYGSSLGTKYKLDEMQMYASSDTQLNYYEYVSRKSQSSAKYFPYGDCATRIEGTYTLSSDSFTFRPKGFDRLYSSSSDYDSYFEFWSDKYYKNVTFSYFITSDHKLNLTKPSGETLEMKHQSNYYLYAPFL